MLKPKKLIKGGGKVEIREEIERLRRFLALSGPAAVVYQGMTGGGYAKDQSYNEALDDVLSILDEWELVAEGPLTNLLATRISDLIERNAYKGDTIAIYVRRNGGLL